MSIRLKDETIEGLKEIKEIYDVSSLDKAAKIAIKNTPTPVDIVEQPPAFLLKATTDTIKSLTHETIVTWNMLRESKQGDIFGLKKDMPLKFLEYATVLFKDENGVFIKFETKEIYKNTEKIELINVAYYSFL